MLELSLMFLSIATIIYAILANLAMAKYNKKVAEYKALEKVNEDLLIDKYKLKQRLGEG